MKDSPTSFAAEDVGGGVTGEEIIRAVSLHKHFGRSAALNGLSINIARGEVLAVQGPSGSGKSTLLLCLSGIVKPDRGEVFVAGRPIHAMSDRALSELRLSQFGFVFQYGQLVPELNALENVSLPLRLGGATRAVARERAQDWLGRLDVDDVARKRPGEMSGGQAQRVAIARAMIGKPRVIFADEPTGSLDSANASQVLRLLTTAAGEGGASVVMVTHDSAVASHADRTVVIRDGVMARK